jgi:hypothetical protein
VARSTPLIVANPPSTMADYAADMDTDALDHGNDGVGQVFMMVMRVFWGPLTWPLIIGNVLGYLWCAYQVLV